MDRKVIVGIGVGCLAAVLVGVGGCAALFYWASREPENIAFTVQAPLEVKVGEDFTIDVEIENTAGRAQTLYSVDIGKAYFEGVAITKSEPAFKQSSDVPIDNSRSYEFKQEIPAGGKLQVRFFARAVKAADCSADLDICVNSESSFLTQQLRTVVQ